MPDKRPPTSEELITLAGLLKLKVGTSYVQLTSGVLGRALGVKQQTASKRLIQLEKDGMIERTHSGRGVSVRLTGAGFGAINGLYAGLKSALEAEPVDMYFRGSVFTGLGEGAYYVSLKGYARAFREILGFEPFPGTLNLRLPPAMAAQRRRLAFLQGLEVPGFTAGKRSFGPVWCFRALVEEKYPAGALAIERTHYDDTVLELVSPVDLRRALKLNDGDEVSVTVLLG